MTTGGMTVGSCGCVWGEGCDGCWAVDCAVCRAFFMAVNSVIISVRSVSICDVMTHESVSVSDAISIRGCVVLMLGKISSKTSRLVSKNLKNHRPITRRKIQKILVQKNTLREIIMNDTKKIKNQSGVTLLSPDFSDCPGKCKAKVFQRRKKHLHFGSWYVYLDGSWSLMDHFLYSPVLDG